jgi:hypothetical protein
MVDEKVVEKSFLLSRPDGINRKMKKIVLLEFENECVLIAT